MLAWLQLVGVAILTLISLVFRFIERLFSHRDEIALPKRVAVIGGGIAGFGAAHALCHSGIEVDLFEACDEPGGNAKTHEWRDGARTGLSVLAWPVQYFRNYGALLKQLGLKTTPVELRFFLRRKDGDSFVHGRTEALSIRYADDLKRWSKLVELVRSCNKAFARSDVLSLYHFSMLNPMNVLPLRFLCRLMGVSSGFYDEIITPLHCTTFLDTDLTSVPSLVVPTIDDLIPLNGIPKLESWIGSSRSVFDGIAKLAGEKLNVHTSSPVSRVRQEADGRWTVYTPTKVEGGYDRIIFASNAKHASTALPMSWGWMAARRLLGSVEFADETCPMFRKGIIHSDATVIPPDVREEVTRTCCNYIVGCGEDEDGCCTFENTFILSSWYPTVVKGGGEGDGRPRFVSYGLQSPERVKEPEGEVTNLTNHPKLTPLFCATTMLLRLLQGQGGIFFCGSMATPGNGHDLSLCSGLVMAMAMGARYPFEGDGDAKADLERLRVILGL